MKKYENYSSFPEAVDPLIFFQDIDIPHKAVYDTFRQMISNGQYSAALEYINSQDDVDGYFADLYNLLEERILNLQYHLKCMDNRIIYSSTIPGADYPYLHNNIIWLDYDITTGQVTPNSQDTLINEIIKENMEIRFIDRVSSDSLIKSVYATIPSFTVCFEDIYLDATTLMKDNLLYHKLSDVVWFTPKQYIYTEDGVRIVITDETPQGADYYSPVKSVLNAAVDGAAKPIVTEKDKKIEIVSGSDPINKVIIYNSYGEKIISYTYSANHRIEDFNYVLAYKTSEIINSLHTKNGNLISVYTNDISIIPPNQTDFKHVKFRIMNNLPTMLWHRLSFVTDEKDAKINNHTTVKKYLDDFLNYTQINTKKIVSAYKSLGVDNLVEGIPDAIDSYTLLKKDVIDTIEEVTKDTGHLNVDSSPTAISIYVLNKMYSPIIAAVRRAAVKKGIAMSEANTLDNAIKTLKQFISRYVKIKDSSGNSYVLTTKAGQFIKLKGGI